MIQLTCQTREASVRATACHDHVRQQDEIEIMILSKDGHYLDVCLNRASARDLVRYISEQLEEDL